MANPLDVRIDVNVEGLPDLQKVSGEMDKVGDASSQHGEGGHRRV